MYKMLHAHFSLSQCTHVDTHLIYMYKIITVQVEILPWPKNWLTVLPVIKVLAFPYSAQVRVLFIRNKPADNTILIIRIILSALV